MKKITLQTLFIALISLLSISSANAQFHDDFSLPNDTDGLKTRGYLPYFRGGALGTAPMWFQGNPNFQPAYNGAPDSFVQSNFNSVAGATGVTIDNWLVLPALNVNIGDAISFYSISVTNSNFPDSIRVMYSDAGDSIPEATTWVQLGNFEVTTSGNWELKTFYVTTAGANARFAIRYAVADGGPNGANSDNIGIDELNVYTPASIDGGVSQINTASGCGLTNATPIEITISNYGLSKIGNFPVSYSFNGGATITENFNDSIAIGDTAHFVFAATADLSVSGDYAFYANSGVVADGNTANDGDSAIVSNVSVNLTAGDLTEDFEAGAIPLGWNTEDVDGTGFTWALSTVGNITAAQSIRAFENNVNGASEDWLFTTCVELQSTNNYKLTFYKRLSLNYAGSLGVYVGTGDNVPAMTQTLEADAAMTGDGIYYEDTLTFTVPTTGTYHIGFKAINSDVTNTIALRLDDVLLHDAGPVGVKEITSDLVSIYPNPSTGVVNFTTVSGSTKIEVYNAMGALVYSDAKLTAGKHSLDLTNFSKGIYSIKATNGNAVDVKKVTIN